MDKTVTPALIADMAFGSNDLIADLDRRGAKIVMARHPRRASPRQIDTEMYQWRHLIENFFCKLKNSSASPCAPTRPTRALRR